MLLYLPVLAFLATLAVSAPPKYFKCNKHWGDGIKYTVNGNCFFAEEALRQGHYTYEIMAVESLQPDKAWLVEAVKNIHESVVDTFWQYEMLGGRFSNFHFIFTNTNDPEYPKALADTYRPNWPGGPCQTRIYNNFKKLSAINQKFAIAHELFHCVTQTMIGMSTDDSSWWIEGSASYFANWIYPESNYEWERNSEFQLSSSIHKQKSPYSTEQFFQSLEMWKGPSGILHWIMKQKFSDSASEERTRLSHDSVFADDFHHFAKQYSIGKIRDTSGAFPALGKVPTKEVALKGNRAADVKFGTFKIRQFKLDVKPGRTVQMYYHTKYANLRASYKENGAWKEIVAAPAHGQDGFMELPCNNGKLIPLLILVTSTDDIDVASFELVIDEIKKNKACKCEVKRRKRQDEGEDSVDVVGGESGENEGEDDKCEDMPEEWGSCEDSKLAVDPCFVGKNWQVDEAQTEALIREEMKKVNVEDFKINSVKVSGMAGMKLAKNTTMEFKDYTVDMSITAAEMNFPVRTVINGKAEATLNMLTGGDGTGTFCLKVTWGEGKAVGSNPLIGDIEFDFGKNFISQRMSIQYACTANHLRMGGNVDGVQWGPYSYTA